MLCHATSQNPPDSCDDAKLNFYECKISHREASFGWHA
jgi:hypothetical protein